MNSIDKFIEKVSKKPTATQSNTQKGLKTWKAELDIQTPKKTSGSGTAHVLGEKERK